MSTDGAFWPTAATLVFVTTSKSREIVSVGAPGADVVNWACQRPGTGKLAWVT